MEQGCVPSWNRAVSNHGTGLCPRLHMPASRSLPVWGSETPSGDFYLTCDPDSSSDVVMHTPSSPQPPAFLPPLPFLPRLSFTQPPCNSHTGLLLTGSHAHQACLPQSLYTCCSLCLELPDYPVPSPGSGLCPCAPPQRDSLPTSKCPSVVPFPLTHDFVFSRGVAHNKGVHVLARVSPGRWAWGTGTSLLPLPVSHGVEEQSETPSSGE